MAPLNFKDNPSLESGYQVWIIEDSWEGTIRVAARLVQAWQGICGSHRLLEDREGRWYWWAVFFGSEDRGALQKVVTFPDWDSLATELGLAEREDRWVEGGLAVYH